MNIKLNQSWIRQQRISVVILAFALALMLMFTNAVMCVLLLSKSEEWKSVVTDKENNKFKLAKAPAEHVYYDEDSITYNQTIRHYSPSVKLMGSKKQDDVLCSDKMMMADFPIHMQSSLSLLYDNKGYDETELEYLRQEGTPKKTPVVMLIQNGRIKTSFVVKNMTNVFVDRFHKYLMEYLKKGKCILYIYH